MMSCKVTVFRRIILGVATLSLGLPTAALGQAPTTQPATQPARPQIYDPAADAKAQIAAAVEKAKRENQRVLLMFGGNWCGWCHKLHELFKSDKDIAKALLYEYQLVLVNAGRFDKNIELAKGYEVDFKKSGLPFLVVLDGDGKVLTRQETGSLEDGDHHDPEKVAAFLDKWKAEPRDAEKVLADALERAAKEEKSVLVHLGAPWCPWCRKLDDFLAGKDIAEIIRVDIIEVKIDTDRMKNSKKVAGRWRKDEKGGLPWMVLVDGQGQAIATSDGSKGNIGYPAEPEEISHFIGMLKKAGKHMSADQIGKVEKALKEAAAEAKAASHPSQG